MREMCSTPQEKPDAIPAGRSRQDLAGGSKKQEETASLPSYAIGQLASGYARRREPRSVFRE